MKKAKGIFITGTDTGVGKTYIAGGIAHALRQRGVNVGVMKPAETGCRRSNGKLFPSDAAALLKAAGSRADLDLVNPYRFSRPLAPAVAAELEGKQIYPKRIMRAFHSLSRQHEFIILEGAGGIMVPLTRNYTYLDLACDLCLPVLIVARPSLGTMNHSLLTVNALQQRKVRIAGIVINYAENRKMGTAERTSPQMIERMSGIPILAVIRHGEQGKWKMLQTG